MPISRRFLLLAAPSILVSGCGFHLRGSYSLPFEKLYLAMPQNDPFTVMLVRNLKAQSSVSIVSSPQQAQAILSILSQQRTREETAYNAQGRAREYELGCEMAFRLANPKGFTFMPDVVLSATRNVTYNESQFLSHDFQDALIYKEMQNDIMNQLLRRIAAAKPIQADESTELDQ